MVCPASIAPNDGFEGRLRAMVQGMAMQVGRLLKNVGEAATQIGFQQAARAGIQSPGKGLLRLLLVLLAGLGAACAAGQDGDDEPLLRATRQGPVLGAVAGQAQVWHGIPYAAAPEGERRWRPPQPPPKRSAPLDARQARPEQRCIQAALHSAALEIEGSEDCLTLNIWAPQHAADSAAALPVMIWLHGGANLRGGAADYDASALAARGDVVVVTLNYRLGLLGWLHHPLLQAPPDVGGGANFGTLDQIAALQWVRDNIASFGGDPDRVTLFGESAGGDNVLALLVSPRSRGLFHRAIIQSGSGRSVDLQAAANPVDADPAGLPLSSTEIIARLLQDAGRAESREQALAVIEREGPRLAPWLRQQPVAALMSAFASLAAEHMNATGAPALLPVLLRDGEALPEEGIRAAIAAGRFHRVPVMIGATRDEFTILLPFITPRTGFYEAGADGWPRVTDPGDYQRAAELLSQQFWRYAVDTPARHIGRHAPVFVYRFDWDQLQPAPWLGGLELGATHGLDVAFVFGSRDLGPDYLQMNLLGEDSLPGYARLSRAMIDYWAAFAAEGRPGSGRHGHWPWWPRWHGDSGGAWMRLDDPGSGAEAGSGSGVSRLAVELTPPVPALQATLQRLREEQGLQRHCEFLRDIEQLGRFVGLPEDTFVRHRSQMCDTC